MRSRFRYRCAGGRSRFVFAVFGALSLAVALGSIGVAEDAAPPVQPPAEKPKPPSLLRLLPEQTVFVITLRDMRGSLERLKGTSLWKVATDESVQAIFGKAVGEIKTRFQAVEQNFRLNLPVFTEGLQGECTIALIDVKEKAGGGNDVSVALGLQMGDKGDKVLAALDDLIGVLMNLGAGAVQYRNYQYEGQTVRLLSGDANGPQIAFALVDGTLLATASQKGIEDLLFNRRKEKDDGLLRGFPSFRTALQCVGESHEACVYLNVARVLSMPVVKIPEADRQKLDALGLLGIRAAAYGVRIEGGGFREVLHIEAPERKGLLKILEGEPMGPDAFKHVPASASLALALRVRPELVYDTVLDLVAVEDPVERERIETRVKNLEDTTNLSFKRDVLGAFTGQASLGVSVRPSAGGLPASLIPDALLHVGIRSPLALESTLANLRKLAPKDIEFQALRLAAHPATVVRRPPGEGDPMAVTYALVQDRLVAGLYPLAVRNYLATVAKPSEPPLCDVPAYKELASHLTGNPSLLLYVDLGAILALAYNTAAPIIQINGKAARFIDVNQLPDGDLIRRSFGAAVLAWSADEKGVFAEGFSQTGMIFPSAALGGAAARAAVRRAQDGGAAIHRAEIVSLGAALRAYAADNNGAFPKTMDELVPKYLDRIPEGEPIVYRGAQAQPMGVVAHVRADLARGPVPLLLQDGSVRSVFRNSLDAAIEQGFDPAMGPKGERPVAPTKPTKPVEEKF